MKKLFRYSALVLGLVLSAFFILMAFDSFPRSLEPKELIGFLINVFPGLILVAATLVSFKFPVAGVFIFAVLTIAGTIFDHTYSNIQLFMIVSLPMFIILILLFTATQGKPKKQI